MKARFTILLDPKKRSRRSDRAPGRSVRAWTCAEVLRKLEDLANPEHVQKWLISECRCR